MRRTGCIAAALAATLFATAARAQSAPPAAPPAAPPPATPPPATEVGGYTGPNRTIIATGALSLLIAYVPGIFIASNSRISSDSKLSIPIAGPWLDLADRPQCGGVNIPCRVETGNQVLLVTSGLFQVWGIAAIVTGLFVKEEPRAVKAAPRATVQIAPTIGVGGYGVTAVGSF